MKKDWVKEGYRRWFNYLDEEVPEEAWTGIADQLDIDQVWDNLSEELDRAERPVWTWAARAAAVIALLVSALAAYWYLSPSQNGTRTPLAQQAVPPPASAPRNQAGQTAAPANTSPEKDSLAIEGSPGNAGAGGETPAISPAERLAETVPVDGPGTPALPATENSGNLLSQQGRLAKVHTPPALTAQTIPTLTAQPAAARLSGPPAGSPRGLKAPAELIASIPPTNRETEDPAKQHAFISLQRVGLVSAYKNTWMLNHETFNGLQSATLNATTFTYGTSAGINAGFLLNGKHKVSAELYLSSHNGQKYRQYIEARYQSKSIALDYYKLQLYYQLPVFSGKGDVLAGAYGSYLKRGRERIAGEARTVGRFYRTIDYGIMAGYQFNLPVNNRLLLQPGIRVNYGLPNIFKGNQQIPQNFLRTHNAAAGLYLGVSYRLY